MYICQVFHSSFKSFLLNQFKFIISTSHVSLNIPQSIPHSNQIILPQQPSHSPKDALCHHGAFKHLFFTIWFDTVSLSIMRDTLQNGNHIWFPSLAISREGTPILFPLQNGNGWALHCQTTVGHFLSISWPMIPGLLNSKRIISTNNCRLANRQLSSRDGTYVYQCHATSQYSLISISFTIFNFLTTIHFNITISLSVSCTFAIPYNILTFQHLRFSTT